MIFSFRGRGHEAASDRPGQSGLGPRQGEVKICQERSIIIGGAETHWLQQFDIDKDFETLPIIILHFEI